MSDKCTRLFWINFSKDCVDLFIATTLFFLQLFTYKRLINLMQSRLHALYQQHKKRTLILYVSSSICFFFRILYVGFYVVVRVDRLEAYIDSSVLSTQTDIIRKFLFLTNTVSLVFYVYYSTKYIDLILFVYLWMLGYNVGSRFHTMSYLITKSCLHNEADDGSEDTDSQEILQSSLYGTQGFLVGVNS